VKYDDLLKDVARRIKMISTITDPKKSILWIKDDSFGFDIDRIADHVAQQYATSTKFPFEDLDGVSYATTHMNDLLAMKTFSDLVRDQIVRPLQEQIQKVLQSTTTTTQTDLSAYATQLLTPLAQFQGNTSAGLTYQLGTSQLIRKQRLHMQPQKPDASPWLKAHKVTLTVRNMHTINQQLIENIMALVEKHPQCDEEDVEDVKDALTEEDKQEKSQLNQLNHILLEESVARIQRDLKIRYLRYLVPGIQEWIKSLRAERGTDAWKRGLKPETIALLEQKQARYAKGYGLLIRLIERMQDLNVYFKQANNDIPYYDITFQGEKFNYRDICLRSETLDILPIIPEFDGFLGEMTDLVQQTKTFVSGVKLKLNGEVHAHGGRGRPVLLYYADLLDPTSKEYKERQSQARFLRSFQEKVLRTAILYYFVFKNMEQKDFQAGKSFEADILTALKAGDDEKTNQAFKRLQTELRSSKVQENLAIMRELLIDFLVEAKVGPVRHEDSLVLCLDRKILSRNVNQMVTNNIFFREPFDEKNGRSALKYVFIQEDVLDTEVVCKLPLTAVFEPIYYFPAEQQDDTFHMTHETEGIQVLPIFLAPVDAPQDQPDRLYTDQYKGAYKDIKRIAFYYRHRPQIHSDSARAFVYRFTYTLLSYVCVRVLTDSLSLTDPRQLFCPLICLHAEPEDTEEQNGRCNDETFMHGLAKMLAHMIAEDYSSGSQGFYLETINEKGFKLKNALYSLYSALPHTFRQTAGQSMASPPLPSAQRLDKLAILVVSSRKSDENRKDKKYFKSVIYGKVVGIERRLDNSIRLATLSTFSEVQDNQNMYTQPVALLEQVKQCHQLGYQHILYVAKAPYSSTLNISKGDPQDLFFMNKDVIQAMRAIAPSLRVYPVFCDKYYVINRKIPASARKKPTLKAESLYIDDVAELGTLAKDPSKRSLVFFNLFSGIRVKPNSVYNGVMSYSTLVNVYENDPAYDRYIWSDVLGETVPGTVKADLLDFITLLHFVRYEKAGEQGFKLDPYTDIIGDDSVGKLAVFPHMKEKKSFNALAFLTTIRAVINVSG
jgi:hypothetical protein